MELKLFFIHIVSLGTNLLQKVENKIFFFRSTKFVTAHFSIITPCPGQWFQKDNDFKTNTKWDLFRRKVNIMTFKILPKISEDMSEKTID